MRKALIVLILLFTLVLGLTLVSADEPEPGSPEDNACNPGGVLYREDNQDGCPSLWHWKAGWFLARFLRGEISRADFPKEFESVLPPLPEEAAPAIISFCHTDGSSYNFCFYSGQTGDGTWLGGPIYFRFVTTTASCPVSVSGIALAESQTGTTYAVFVGGYGFTTAELDALGILPSWCAYY
jgi:hypothetical protein